MDDNRRMQSRMSANTPIELMATKGRNNRDKFFKYLMGLVDDVKSGAGEMAAHRDFKKHVDTLEGQDLEDYDFSVSEQTRPLSQTEDPITQTAPEDYRNGGGVGSLNETARNMFRSYEDGGDISPVPRGEDMNLEEIREEMDDYFGSTSRLYGNENIEKGIGFFRSAGKDFEEGGGAHYIRQGADYLSDMGKAGIYSLAGAGEKGVALGAEVIDDIASRFINTSGEEKLTDELLAMFTEAPVLGPLIGKAGSLPRLLGPKTVVKNANPGAYKGQLFEELSDADKIRRKANALKNSRRNTIRDVTDKTNRQFAVDPDARGRFAKGGMVGIGAYQNYMV
tara:strand:+ start:3785 stop:4795 length:1011 start_codon:yes stop_codon:yes gene_type:complete